MIRATGSRSQLEVSPRGRRSVVSETSSVEEKNWGQATVDGWMDGRMEEISWQEQKDKWLWFGRKEWKSPHHFKYQACSERNREVQLCVTSGPTGVQKVQELKWRKLQNTKTTTAQTTNRVKNERLKHKLLLIRRTLDLFIRTQKLISFCCCPPDAVFWPDVCFCWGRAGVPYSKLRSSSSCSITAPEEHLLRCIVDLQVFTVASFSTPRGKMCCSQ